MKLRLLGSIATFVFVLSGVFVAGSWVPTPASAEEPILPIVYVHGGAGSAAQYETQAMRWASNHFPNVVTGIDRTSSVPAALNPMLDEFFDAVMAETGDNRIYVIAHSLGTSLMVNYLNSSPERSARVAKYINIDGATGTSCPGNPSPVNCLGIFGQGIPGRKMGDNNVYFPDQSHTQTVTSEQSFVEQYRFLTGKVAATTLVLPEPPGKVEIAGKVIDFPANNGADGATMEIWEVHGNSGARKDSSPMAIIDIGPTGEWGPVRVNGQKYYEFAVTRPDTARITHYYRQPFIRSNYLVCLLSSPPTSPIIINTATGPDHSAAVLIRYKEWWSDQGVAATPCGSLPRVPPGSMIRITPRRSTYWAIRQSLLDCQPFLSLPIRLESMRSTPASIRSRPSLPSRSSLRRPSKRVSTSGCRQPTHRTGRSLSPTSQEAIRTDRRP